MQLRTGRTRSWRLKSRTNSLSSDSSIEDLREISILPRLNEETRLPVLTPYRRTGGGVPVTSRLMNATDGDTSESSSPIGRLTKDFGTLSNVSDSGISGLPNSSSASSLKSVPSRRFIHGQHRRGATEREIGSSSEDSSSSQAYYSSTSSSSEGDRVKKTESPFCRRRRWLKTADILKKSGLLDVTIKTAELLRENQKIQKEIEALQRETNKFVLSVLSNPENKHVLDSIRSQAQLYEFIVPGSPALMMSPTSTLDSTLSFPSSFEDLSSLNDTISSDDQN